MNDMYKRLGMSAGSCMRTVFFAHSGASTIYCSIHYYCCCYCSATLYSKNLSTMSLTDLSKVIGIQAHKRAHTHRRESRICSNKKWYFTTRKSCDNTTHYKQASDEYICVCVWYTQLFENSLEKSTLPNIILAFYDKFECMTILYHFLQLQTYVLYMYHSCILL